jgi:hypothetical protein
MRRLRKVVYVLAPVVVAAQLGCRSAPSPEAQPLAAWDVDRAEVLRWQSDHPSFEQQYALEASGLAISENSLFVPSEKYGRLLLIEISNDLAVATVQLAVPRHAELEGVARTTDGVLLCDEAHAAVYEVSIDREEGAPESLAGAPLPVRRFLLEGVDVEGGKIGLEGIEIDPDGSTVHLLLERNGTAATGCVSRIWSLQRSDQALRSRGEPIEVELEDCNWRLAGLAWWEERLIALKTQFPGERYEIVTVDLESGATEVVANLTELLRSLAGEGWSNNVEGIAVGGDGSLWLVADNAVTGVIDDPVPGPAEAGTLLLRIPSTKGQ